MGTWMRVRRQLLCGLAGILITVAPAAAQAAGNGSSPDVPNWDLWDAVGYAGLGVVVSLPVYLGTNCPFSDCAGMIAAPVLALTGLAVGARIGRRARSKLSQGQGLTPGHRKAVAVGAVAAWAGLGMLASAALTGSGERDGDTALGSDEMTRAYLGLGGAALGVLYVWSKWDGLVLEEASVAPAVVDGSRIGLTLSVRF